MPQNTTNSKSLLFKNSTSTNPRKPVFSQIMFIRLNSEDVGKIRMEQVCQLCNELMQPGNAGIGTNQKDPKAGNVDAARTAGDFTYINTSNL